MFYKPDQPGTPPVKNAFMSVVVPRPIGWISTLDANGKANLAPYSFYAAVSVDPPIIMLSSEPDANGGRKETERNIMATGEFVINVPTWAQQQEMMTSAKYIAQDAVGQNILESEPSETVKPARVKGSPVQLECQLIKSDALPAEDDPKHVRVMFAKVTGIHIDDSIISNGYVDLDKMDPVAATGYPLVRVKDGIKAVP